MDTLGPNAAKSSFTHRAVASSQFHFQLTYQAPLAIRLTILHHPFPTLLDSHHPNRVIPEFSSTALGELKLIQQVGGAEAGSSSPASIPHFVGAMDRASFSFWTKGAQFFKGTFLRPGSRGRPRSSPTPPAQMQMIAAATVRHQRQAEKWVGRRCIPRPRERTGCAFLGEEAQRMRP